MSECVLVIAEIGVNHNGDMVVAERLIDAAVEAGADLVKFQTFNTDLLATEYAPKADYQSARTGATESQYAMLRGLELSLQDHRRLIAYCESRRIAFLSTAFDIPSLDLLEDLGAERFKIPSGEITNLPYLRRIGASAKPVILSTGMATLGEIEAALEVLERAGTSRSRITVLHCNTEYPTPMQDVNLLAMCSIRNAFGVQVGYSDHTPGIEVAIAATALGASVIEKHLTLDRELPGPDHKASLEPTEFAAMVRGIRNIEQALGDGIKRPSASEAGNRPVARKSLVASAPIRRGEIFSPDNVTAKRPGTGISPMRWDEIMGRQASRDYQPNELIEW